MTIPLIDNHGHSLLIKFNEATEAEFVSAFSESKLAHLMTDDIKQSVTFLQLQKRLFEMAGCSTLEEYLNFRASAASSKKLTTQLFIAAGLERILLDDGYARELRLDLSDFAAASSVPISRIVRIEPILEDLIKACDTAREVEARLEEALFENPLGIVALKTIVCYRGGLGIFVVDKDDAEANYFDCRRHILNDGRLRKSSFYHYILLKTFDLAIARDIPVQVHCGIGDDDADLSLSNPDLLHRLLRRPRFSGLKMVLLHSYPFLKEAAILASLYPNVYYDLSLASFLLADQKRLYSQALSCAPYSKLLAGTDGHSQPETYYQGAMALRKGLGDALHELVLDKSVSYNESVQIERAVLQGNARKLYKLPALI